MLNITPNGPIPPLEFFNLPLLHCSPASLVWLLYFFLSRCKKCLTKTYCSKDCQAKDWEEKHQGLCQSGGEERKVKGGSEARVEAGLVWFGRTEEAKNMLVKAKEMCEKKGKEGKKVKAGKGGSEKKS